MSGVVLQFLGSGDAFGTGGRLQTCMRLTGDPGGSLLIDCGASSLVAMKRAGVDPGTLHWIVLSHLHGDHFAGLPFVILDGQFSRRRRPLVVAGPPGVGDRVMAALDVLFPGSALVARRFAVEFVELSERCSTTLGPAVVTPFAVDHPSGAPAYALRIAYAGKVITYSGDTAWTEALIEAAADADLFVCEGYVFDSTVRYHLDYATVMASRSRLGCRRLIFTHLGPDMLAHRAEIEAETAEDGMLVTLD